MFDYILRFMSIQIINVYERNGNFDLSRNENIFTITYYFYYWTRPSDSCNFERLKVASKGLGVKLAFMISRCNLGNSDN